MTIKLPEYEECAAAVEAGEATALQAFIESQEPAGTHQAMEFRTLLLNMLREVAHGGQDDPAVTMHKTGAISFHRNLNFAHGPVDLYLGSGFVWPHLKAWLHVMHMEGGQKQRVLSFKLANPFGEPGVNYSEDYKVESIPLGEIKERK